MTWQERATPLWEHLEKLHGAKLWEERGGRLFQQWLLQYWVTPGGHAYLVQIFLDGSGWNVFKPVSDSNKVQDTLDQII